MSLAEKESRLIARFSIIEDLHERLAAITARGKKWAALGEGERTEERLVPGCSSRVWIAGDFRDGVCHLRMDADSPLVKGLAALVCELYDGESPADILATTPKLMASLGFDRMISPTRLHGLDQIRATIQNVAREHS